MQKDVKEVKDVKETKRTAPEAKSAETAAVALSAEEEQEFRDIFNLVDRDNSGSITGEELKTLLGMLSIKATQDEVDKMIAEIDANNDGPVSLLLLDSLYQQVPSSSKVPSCTSE